MLQFSNLDRVMETETISKNGASSKSRTSRRNFLSAISLALLLVSVVFIGCSKDDEKGGINNGTYINQTYTSYKIVIAGSSWTSIKGDVNWGKGTYTLSGNNVSGHSTHAWNNGTWVPYTNDSFSGVYDAGSHSFTITTDGNDYHFDGTYVRQ